MADQDIILAILKCERCGESFSETFSLEQHHLVCPNCITIFFIKELMKMCVN